ncbi:MAG: endonuclease/exonuclease/phosphatase family protein, partial [Luteimonas sp.]
MDILYKRTHLQPPSRCVPMFPSWRPQRAIDHILVSAPLALQGMRAMPAADSDHLALSIELDVPAHAVRAA